MKLNYILAFAISLLLCICSCNNNSSINNANNEHERTDSVSISNDSISQIKVPENDSIACYLDSVIGRFHVKHFTQNDSTSRFVPGYLHRYVINNQEIDSTSLPYARKACIFVYDRNNVIKKEITRSELHKVIQMEDIEYFHLYIKEVKFDNEKNLVFTVSLSMEDTYYVFECDYVYKNGKFKLEECREYDDEGMESWKVE